MAEEDEHIDDDTEGGVFVDDASDEEAEDADVEDTEEDPVDDDSDESGGDDAEDDAEDDGQADEGMDKRVADLEAASKDRESHISDLNKALYGYRQEIKKLKSGEGKEDEPSFTDAQITKILDEHKDDPAVLLQVVKQVAKQQTAGVKEDAISAQEVAQTQTQVNGFLHQNWPKLQDESSAEFGQLQQAKGFMKLDDHPYGDFLSMGALMLQKMPEMIEDAKKEARETALKDRTEVARKDKIKKTKLSGKGKKAASQVTITDDIKATAKAIGIKGDKQIALYAKMLKSANKGQNAMTVEG